MTEILRLIDHDPVWNPGVTTHFVERAVLALLDRWGFPYARHWPLGFVALAVFLLFRNDPEARPLGPQGFWESLGDGGILQHRLAVALACALGTLEWRARAGRGRRRLPYLFPVLGFFGGILLLTHSHTATSCSRSSTPSSGCSRSVSRAGVCSSLGSRRRADESQDSSP
jgi:hypothetical protein